MTYYIYTYRDFWEKHSCFWCSAHIPAKAGTDAGLEATHTGRMLCFGGGSLQHISQST